MSIEKITRAVAERQFPLDFAGHFIGNLFVAPDKAEVVNTSTNPSRNTELITCRYATALGHRALDIAQKRFQSLRSPKGRTAAVDIDAIRTFRQAIVDYSDTVKAVLQTECGKPAWEAETEVHASVAFIDEIIASHDAAKANPSTAPGTEEEALGIAVAYIPFSTPLTSFIHYLCGSLYAKAPMVMVCSYHATLTVSVLTELVKFLDLPDGSLSVLFADYSSFKKLLSDRRARAIIYTGSREHCYELRSEYHMQLDRQLILQSGGKNAAVIGETADLDAAVARVMLGAFKSAGQLCHSTSRVLVADPVFDSFTAKLGEAVAAMKIGPTDGPVEGEEFHPPTMGPLYSHKAVDKFLRFQTMAKRDAVDTLLWGKAILTETGGYFVQPGVHILESIDRQSAYQNTIQMAPDLAIYRYYSPKEVVAAIDNTDALYVCSLMAQREEFEAIEGYINTPNVRYNKATVEFNDVFPVWGKQQCGQNRWGLLHLDKLLTYPKFVDSDDSELLLEQFAKTDRG